jgi:hypothetical protein
MALAVLVTTRKFGKGGRAGQTGPRGSRKVQVRHPPVRVFAPIERPSRSWNVWYSRIRNTLWISASRPQQKQPHHHLSPWFRQDAGRLIG